MDGMRARRQVVQVEGDQHAMVKRLESGGAARLAIQSGQPGNGLGLLRRLGREAEREQGVQ